MRLTGPQIAAAIALSGMTQEMMAAEAKLGRNTLTQIIKGDGAYREDTMRRIRNVLEVRGIEFTEQNGVRQKSQGVDMLIGETVAELVRESFHLQLVDYVRVKGKTRALRVYAVLGEKSRELDREMAAYLAAYESAMSGYTRGEFETACSQFRIALDLRPDDPLATVYFERCAELAEQRPERWDGVFVMKTK